MTVWTRMCTLAIARHVHVWQCCGCNPLTWPLHEMQLITVYGIDTYERACKEVGADACR